MNITGGHDPKFLFCSFEGNFGISGFPSFCHLLNHDAPAPVSCALTRSKPHIC